MSATLTRRTTRVLGGTLSWLAAGPEGGSSVVLLHGIPTGAELWRAVAPHLADAGWRVAAPDLPGYGESRFEPTADHSLFGAAVAVAAWLRTEAVAPAWIVGHDLGGAVAQLLAVHHPDVVGRLTLIDSVLDRTWPIPKIRLLRAVARAGLLPGVLALTPPPLQEGLGRRLLAPGFADATRLDDATLRRVFLDGKFTDPAGRVAFARHAAALDAQQTAAVADRLAEVAVPAQLVWADRDVFQPAAVTGRRLQHLLPAEPLVTIADAGHFVPLEQPDRLAAALLDWAGTG